MDEASATRRSDAIRGDGADLVIVTFRYRGADDPFRGLLRALAQTSATAPGMIWKTWFIYAGSAEGGSLHLFADGSSLEHWLRGPGVARLRTDPEVGDLRLRRCRTVNEIPLVAIRRWEARDL